MKQPTLRRSPEWTSTGVERGRVPVHEKSTRPGGTEATCAPSK